MGNQITWEEYIGTENLVGELAAQEGEMIPEYCCLHCVFEGCGGTDDPVHGMDNAIKQTNYIHRVIHLGYSGVCRYAGMCCCKECGGSWDNADHTKPELIGIKEGYHNMCKPCRDGKCGYASKHLWLDVGGCRNAIDPKKKMEEFELMEDDFPPLNSQMKKKSQ